MNKILNLPSRGALLLSMLLFSACGTLEFGLETSIAPESELSATPAPSLTMPAESVGTPMTGATAMDLTAKKSGLGAPSLSLEPAGLHVAFVKNGNVWLWTESTEAKPLTHHGQGGVSNVSVSDDGTIVAFIREQALWAVNSDGSNERQLISAADLMIIGPASAAVRLHSIDWIPGTHTLAFNTRDRAGVARTDDLHLVDAGTLERTTLLQAGQGGEFYFSPDGRQIAIVQSGGISLIDSDGDNLRPNVLTYTPIQIAPYMQQLTSSVYPPKEESEYPPGSAFEQLRYYIQPVWAPDSNSLQVAIPPADPLAQPVQQTTLWQISASGDSSRMLTAVQAKPLSPVLLSPDLHHIAYVPQSSEGFDRANVPELAVISLDGGETVATFSEAYNLYGWSTDSQHVAFATIISEQLAVQIGQIGQVDQPTQTNNLASDMRWVDGNHYIFLAPGSSGWDLLLAEIDGPNKLLAGELDAPVYDFTS